MVKRIKILSLFIFLYFLFIREVEIRNEKKFTFLRYFLFLTFLIEIRSKTTYSIVFRKFIEIIKNFKNWNSRFFYLLFFLLLCFSFFVFLFLTSSSDASFPCSFLSSSLPLFLSSSSFLCCFFASFLLCFSFLFLSVWHKEDIMGSTIHFLVSQLSTIREVTWEKKKKEERTYCEKRKKEGKKRTELNRKKKTRIRILVFIFLWVFSFFHSSLPLFLFFLNSRESQFSWKEK